jgi:ferredoxin
MADKNNLWEENADGPFYVDRTCIACNACVEESPKFFAMNEDDQHAFVKKQPLTEEEVANCEEALQSCPIEAIGIADSTEDKEKQK